MSHLQNSSPFRMAVSSCTVAALFGSVWMMPKLQPQSVPVTAALTRTVGNGPVEFDGMLKNIATGACLDMELYSIDNDHSVGQWDCNNTDNQRIWVDSVADNNTYRLRFKHSGKCIEPAAEEVGAEVRQWVCHSGDFARPNVDANAQHWFLSVLGQGRYSIVHANSGLALTSSGDENGDLFMVEDLTGDDNQIFEFESINQHPTEPQVVGSWGKLIAWPHVPVHAAVTTENTVVTWASNEVDDYPQATGNKFSWSSVYDLDSESFLYSNNTGHDMFCAGTALLEDGQLLASGGNPQASETSLFDPQSNSWSAIAPMRQNRWYGTNVVTGSGDVFSTFAKGAQEIPELYSKDMGEWKDLPGADMSVLRDEQDLGNAAGRVNSSAELQWYSFMHASPDGRIFQSGPLKTMHWYDLEGQGAVQSAGSRMGESRARQFGSAVMYDVGKLLLTGGSDPTVDSEFSRDGRFVRMGSTDTAMTIDISGAAPVVEPVSAMNYRRSNHNAVVLPNGEVYVVGGSEWGLLFDDQYSSWWPEIWNPETGEWRNVAALSTPRNYHSWALLLQDGRVLSGGGGLCGDCSANHPDAQIYTPPYLYQGDGQLANRPQILNGTTESHVGGVLTFNTDQSISKFTMIRLASVTHSINNDQRLINLDAELSGANRYVAQISSNANVVIPGMYWVFAMDAAGVPSTGHLLQVKSTAAAASSFSADVIPESGLSAQVGERIDLTFSLADFDPNTVVFSAMGLPDGLTLNRQTGQLQGRVDVAAVGSFIVSVSDGDTQATERVQYRIENQTPENPPGRSVVSGGGFGPWVLLLLGAFPLLRRR